MRGDLGYFGPISPPDADRYVSEQVRAAALVGIPERLTPRSVAELDAYLERMRPQLRSTAAARATARWLLLPPMPMLVQVATPARAVWLAAAGLAYATLPPWARQLYGLAGPPTTDLGVSLTLRGLRVASRALPPSMREASHYRRAKARLAASPAYRPELV